MTPPSTSHDARSLGGAAYTNGATTGRLLTAAELGERWQVRPAQIYRLSRDGHLPVVRIGRYFRYHLAAIEAFEADGGVQADV